MTSISLPSDKAEAMVSELWQDLLEKSDRTSPADYPDMARITRDEFKDYLTAALSVPAPGTGGAEPVAYASAGQIEGFADRPGDEGGVYIPLRKAPFGMFQMPLYSTPQAGDLGAVKVKPLEWRETFTDRGDGTSELSGWEAENGFGSWYWIEQYFGSDSFGFKAMFDFDVVADKDDPTDAKEACQAHFASRILSALSSSPVGEMDGWQTMDSAPHACHVLAAYFDADCGEWVYGVVMSPPSHPFTHWRMLPVPPQGVR